MATRYEKELEMFKNIEKMKEELVSIEEQQNEMMKILNELLKIFSKGKK